MYMSNTTYTEYRTVVSLDAQVLSQQGRTQAFAAEWGWVVG